jgi:hypothetical protein
VYVYRLLCDPKNRLGDQEGIERFKRLKIFDGIDWDNLLQHEPPFRPIVSIIILINYRVDIVLYLLDLFNSLQKFRFKSDPLYIFC